MAPKVKSRRALSTRPNNASGTSSTSHEEAAILKISVTLPHPSAWMASNTMLQKSPTKAANNTNPAKIVWTTPVNNSNFSRRVVSYYFAGDHGSNQSANRANRGIKTEPDFAEA